MKSRIVVGTSKTGKSLFATRLAYEDGMRYMNQLKEIGESYLFPEEETVIDTCNDIDYEHLLTIIEGIDSFKNKYNKYKLYVIFSPLWTSYHRYLSSINPNIEKQLNALEFETRYKRLYNEDLLTRLNDRKAVFVLSIDNKWCFLPFDRFMMVVKDCYESQERGMNTIESVIFEIENKISR